MILKSIRYVENAKTPQVWKLDELSFGPLNLLVGKNACGKTRVLNVVASLAKFLSGEIKKVFISGLYDAVFENNGKQLRYVLCYEKSHVLKEEFVYGKQRLLTRGAGGKGKIYTQKLKRDLAFQTPTDEVAVVARRDSIQHPLFEHLYEWGASLRHYQFGGQLGKGMFDVLRNVPKEGVDPTNTELVIAVFRSGESKFGSRFKRAIIKNMAAVGYPLSFVGLLPPISIRIAMPGPFSSSEVVNLTVKEKDLPGVTDQNSMSAGMFRALSIIIQLTYSKMASKRSCVLIDDIGEGLDYERACALIKLITTEFRDSAAQIIMTTNDRFTMNTVPLNVWTILSRQSSVVHVFNYKNSKRAFDDFRFTGMNNFDFLATDYIGKGQTRNEKIGDIRRRAN